MCPDFFPGYCSGGHRCSHNADLHMRTRPSRTWSTCVGMFYRPLLKAATNHRYFVPNTLAIRRYAHPTSRRPTMRRRSNSSCSTGVGRPTHGCNLEWQFQTLFTSQITIVTACRVNTEDAICSPMTMTNESLTLQPLNVHKLYPDANIQSMKVLHFFGNV